MQEANSAPGSHGPNIHLFSRDDKDAALSQAHAKGELVTRSVRNLQGMQAAAPRPFCLLKQGFPQSIFSRDGDVTFACVLNRKVWQLGYKRNAETCFSIPSHPRPAQIHSFTDFQKKMFEQEARLESVYSTTTSGHFDDSGFHPGHRKAESKIPVNSNEVIISDCSQITPGAYLISTNRCKTFSELGDKFEKIASFYPERKLPLVLYNDLRGTLTHPVSLEDYAQDMKVLQQGCELFQQFCTFMGIDHHRFLHLIMLNFKPEALLSLLANPPAEIRSAINTLNIPGPIKKAVEDNNLTELIALLEKEEKRDLIHIYNGHPVSLLAWVLDKLGVSKYWDILSGKKPDLLEQIRKIANLTKPLWVDNGYSNNGIYQRTLMALVMPDILIPNSETCKSLLSSNDLCSNEIPAEYLKTVTPTIIHSYLAHEVTPEVNPFSLLDNLLENSLYMAHYYHSVNSKNIIPLDEFHPVKQLIKLGAGSSKEFWQNYQQTHRSYLRKPSIKKFLFEDMKSEALANKQEKSREIIIRKENHTWHRTPVEVLDVKDTLFWLKKHLAESLQVNKEWSYSQLSQAVIEHYYSNIHPEQVFGALKGRIKLSNPKLHHGSSHVTRTQVYAEALCDLFKNHEPFDHLLERFPDFYKLIPLALLYHDIYAEVGAKNREELEAARIFERDINEYGGFQADAIQLVTDALLNKNTNKMDNVSPPFTPDSSWSDDSRLIRCLVRLPASVDVMRLRSLEGNFPEPPESARSRSFNSSMLDLPDELKTDHNFQEKLKAFLIGARDLCSVTGDLPGGTIGSGYLHKMKLGGLDEGLRKQKVERSINARTCVLNTLDENARRQLAFRADILPRSRVSSKETICFSNSDGREINTRKRFRKWEIHTEQDLLQIQLPEMTTCQKLLFGYLPDTSLFDSSAVETIQTEVDRLREHGLKILAPCKMIKHDQKVITESDYPALDQPLQKMILD